MSAQDAAIYLDYQATTPTDDRVVEAMLPFFTAKFGNPHSTSHVYGWEAKDAVDAAREDIANLIGAEAREVVFTSGATESNNLAIKGVARFHHDRKSHVVTCVTEHKCVLESARAAERDGSRVTMIGVRDNGLIDLNELADAITDETALVSIMAVNNEIGVIQPLFEIGALCRERGVYFHTDAAQAVGKVALNVNAMNIDLLSISAHKMYGPMGIGALFIRRRPRVRLTPLFDGGGQERGWRSGTLPAPLCVGFGVAARLAGEEMAAEGERLTAFRQRLTDTICAAIPDAVINGADAPRVPGNLNIAFPGTDAEQLMAALGGIAVSSGSACTSAEVEPSYVLRAIGLDDGLAKASLRIGLGRQTTEDEIDRAGKAIAGEVKRQRQSGVAA